MGLEKQPHLYQSSGKLGNFELNTLIVDADPQANATSGVGLDPNKITTGIYECMINGTSVESVHKTNIKYLDILPSHINLVGAEVEMINLNNREDKMKSVLNEIRKSYDFIIIDCSPSLGLITINALTASDSVIVPVQCEYFALEGLGKLLNTIKIIQARLNTGLQIEGILMTMYDIRLNLSNQVVSEIRTHFKTIAFETIIPRNVKLSESPSYGLPVISHDADSKGATEVIST